MLLLIYIQVPLCRHVDKALSLCRHINRTMSPSKHFDKAMSLGPTLLLPGGEHSCLKMLDISSGCFSVSRQTDSSNPITIDENINVIVSGTDYSLN